MEFLCRTADMWTENPTVAPMRTIATTDDVGFTLATSKKAEEPKRGLRQPRKVVEAPAAPIIPSTVAPPSEPTLGIL